MTRAFKDQLGNSIDISFPPSRIVSLVPSQTELLFDLNLNQEVVGITEYCVLPTHWGKSKSIVGGTKNFDVEKILALKPDLIIGNKEENSYKSIVMLQKRFPVWISDINSLESALAMILAIGKMTDRKYQAELIAGNIQNSFDSLEPLLCVKHTVIYLIWRKPWMAVGANTFIDSILRRIGLENCLESARRYPKLSQSDITNLKPDYIFLSSEPYPFKEQHKIELQALCPLSKIIFVDGQMFSWYGSHLLKSADYFRSLKF